MQYRVLYDFAINTGEFYPTHCRMARRAAPLSAWMRQVHVELHRYRRELNEHNEGMSNAEIELCAKELADYYHNHIEEMDNDPTY